MSLVADYGSSDDESFDIASAEEGDQNEGTTARSIVYFRHVVAREYSHWPRPLQGSCRSIALLQESCKTCTALLF